jgi:hypothetical protein
MVTAAPALPGSKIRDHNSETDLRGQDKFRHSHPDTFWQAGIQHGLKIGLGNIDYEIVTV